MTSLTVGGRPAARARWRAAGGRWALSSLGVASVLVLWWVGGSATRYVPPIGEVLAELPDFLARSDTWLAVAATTQRVCWSLAAALVLGAAAAWVMRDDRFWGRVVASLTGFAIAVPSTVAALLALYLFRRDPLGVYAVVTFICFPFVATVLRQGMRELDQRVAEMGDVYRVNGLARARHVVLPQLVPYVLSATRNEYAHAWKVVVLAELFIVNSGMGYEFSHAFDRFQLTEVLLWLVLFVAVLLVGEYLVFRTIERYVLSWRVL
ncbi:ABC transporter permease subunit [Streptomyces sp. DSM 44915]|uniref:ABC transporter permease subunit n=1 Tax=Streptomyces chisholmiae TaxID=3075540 RepID=A0ABU2JXW2_9ACTN|nr:ABC transporter permease subunit [Streptomyces sp. DSM 44915]MDT0269838.1 ABC transporter permease subunit [Streptomyces sp. DSM 44915]